jgi:AhpD family alkylhydroperoxidase
MARLPPAEAVDEVAERIRARRGGRLRPTDEMLLHSPPVADGWNSLLGAIRQRTTLDAGIRELAILRIAVLNRAPYEWDAHEGEARSAGITDAQLNALRSPSSCRASHNGVFDERRLAALDLVDAMTRSVEVDDAVFAAAEDHFGPRNLVELVTTAAAYNMVSRFLLALQVTDPVLLG